MHQLVYISTSRTEITPEALGDILEVSRTNNRRVDVTGLLIAGGNRFLQVLEGPTAAVMDTYARIERDERHFASVVLTSKDIAARAFGDWSMAFKPGGRATDGSLADIVHTLTEDLDDAGLKAEFRGFAELHSRAA